MFAALTKKFQDLAFTLSKKQSLSEENISEAVRSVRLALLDADVNYSVVSSFIKRVKEKAVGQEKIKGAAAGDQFIKIVHEELVELMGKEEGELKLKKPLGKILLCGLQGSGKTTHAAKLALLLKKKYHKKPLLVALDRQRPAAIEQLEILAKECGVDCFSCPGEKDPLKVAEQALRMEGYDLMIFDTAGRLHVDEELMQQLEKVKSLIDPEEVLFVASSAVGQDAVKTAQIFDQRIGITGSILTMLDGSTRAGAALSIREVTQKPLLFEGVGEKMTDIQVFNPKSMADRILGMGDIINLVRKAEEQFSKEETKEMEEKFLKATFTFDDYLKQMGALRKMGPIKSLLKMIPGAADLPQIEGSEKELAKTEAIILSMTKEERLGKVELIPSRRRRIADGSGVKIEDVNRLIKGFKQMKQMAKQLPKLQKYLGKKRF